MKVLHVVKTSSGALWAAWQAAELRRHGVEIHVALPDLEGTAVAEWESAGAVLHPFDLDVEPRAPWRMVRAVDRARRLVAGIRPDLIHSHFVSTTLVLRAALGRSDAIPRLFQVPGPLHLENAAFRTLDLRSAGSSDWWLASSAYARELYLRAGAVPSRVGLSYYGIRPALHSSTRTGKLRRRLGIPDGALMVGNVSWMYPPKLYLGQRNGLKRHELMIDALARLTRARSNVYGVLVGAAWGNAHWYERLLRARVKRRKIDRVILAGPLPLSVVRDAWADFDCAIHVPSSENCGGVIEPLLAGVPVIGARVGGIPEVVLPGVTGRLVDKPTPDTLASAIAESLDRLERDRQLAGVGGRLVREMFDTERTAKEVHAFYRHILNPGFPAPPRYDSASAASRLRASVVAESTDSGGQG